MIGVSLVLWLKRPASLCTSKTPSPLRASALPRGIFTFDIKRVIRYNNEKASRDK